MIDKGKAVVITCDNTHKDLLYHDLVVVNSDMYVERKLLFCRVLVG